MNFLLKKCLPSPPYKKNSNSFHLRYFFNLFVSHKFIAHFYQIFNDLLHQINYIINNLIFLVSYIHFENTSCWARLCLQRSVANQLNLSLSDRRRKVNLKFIRDLLYSTIDSTTLLSLLNNKVPLRSTRSNALFSIPTCPTNYIV